MRGFLRQFLPICAAAAATGLFAPVQAADVKAARVWAGAEYTRVVFDLSGPLSYRLDQQDGQVVLILDGSAAAGGFGGPSAQGLYKGLSSDRQGGALRLTTRTAPGSQAKSFLLKPSGDSGYRLVLDLYPGDGKAAPARLAAAAVQAASVRVAPVPVASVGSDGAGDSAPPPTLASVSRRGGKAGSGIINSRQAALLLQGQRKVVVAIDAGHGGVDPGAHGNGGTLEKNITLAVARNLADLINRQPGMQAVLTRDGDYFIPLQRRYQIAREHNADMFVSIHADSYATSDARGSSVWVLSPRGKTNEASSWLADRENRADLIGGVSLDDKDDSLAAVLLDLQQGYAMQASESIAGNVLKALGQLGPTHRGYVERANFVVLRSPDVPSILVETAFISNPTEERKLRDPMHQQQLAQAVMGGVKNYFESTPPPGTWFAAQAAVRSGTLVAAAGGDAPAGKGPAVASADDRDGQRADAGVRDLHRVGRGESLRSIARQYGVSVGALKSANNIEADSVHAGTMLSIPAG